MRNIAAYLLLQAGGNQNPSAADIKSLLATVGIETDESRLETLITELNGKSTAELISAGSNKLASVPSGGGGGGGGGSVAAPADSGSAPAAIVEEKKEDKEESDEDDVGFGGLFD